MTDPDWATVKELFALTLDQPVEERDAFLRSECGDDERLFLEVNSLLGAAAEPSNLIENNAIPLAVHIGADEPVYTERRFGSYRIIREIGSGGMGTVFLAERDDGEFTMQVALKIVRQTVAGHEVIEKFKRERQILANLHHRNIAALHDGGVGERGEPFLAMEFVDGVPLNSFAEANQLTVKQRLRLFLQVCSAVSFAHRHLVVHRDIKPSNILVDQDGEPKLLDFGLAKVFEPDAATTQTEMRAFTPAYASPEQILGRHITTSSDIYSLGVVLYELLTGQKPIKVEGKSYDEIVNTVNNVEPPRPSALDAVDDAGGQRQALKGDLDNIVLKALRKEPERRFGSVADLADDIERHLAGRPVSARPNTASYLAGKFIRRNKLAVAAGSLILISMIGGLAVSLWQAEVAEKERDRAEKRFQDIRQLSNSLLFEISPKIERLPGSVDARELLVKRALEYLDSLAAESQSDNSLLAELASAYEKVGDLQGNIDKPNLNDFSGAIASFEKARAIRRSLPADADNQLRLARNYSIASSIRNRQSDVTRALSDAQQARQIFAELTAASPASTENKLAAIEAEIEHGQIYSYNNQYAAAVPIFRQAANDLKSTEQNSVAARQLAAKVLSFLSNALSWDGQQNDAEAEMAKALEIAEKLSVDLPNDSGIQSTVWQTYTLASSIYEDARPELSLEMANRALKVAERASNADKADSQAIYNLARAYSRIGIMLSKLGELPNAAINLQNSERIYNDLIEKEPRNMAYQRGLGTLYVRMGDTSEKRRDAYDALLKYQNSAVIFEKIAADDVLNTLAERDLAQSLRSIAKMQIAISQPAEAKTTLLRAKEILDRLKAKNALGAYDQNLIDDVGKTLNSLAGFAPQP